jgi:hypothetical protein
MKEKSHWRSRSQAGKAVNLAGPGDDSIAAEMAPRKSPWLSSANASTRSYRGLGQPARAKEAHRPARVSLRPGASMLRTSGCTAFVNTIEVSVVTTKGHLDALARSQMAPCRPASSSKTRSAYSKARGNLGTPESSYRRLTSSKSRRVSSVMRAVSPPSCTPRDCVASDTMRRTAAPLRACPASISIT